MFPVKIRKEFLLGATNYPEPPEEYADDYHNADISLEQNPQQPQYSSQQYSKPSVPTQKSQEAARQDSYVRKRTESAIRKLNKLLDKLQIEFEALKVARRIYGVLVLQFAITAILGNLIYFYRGELREQVQGKEQEIFLLALIPYFGSIIINYWTDCVAHATPWNYFCASFLGIGLGCIEGLVTLRTDEDYYILIMTFIPLSIVTGVYLCCFARPKNANGWTLTACGLLGMAITIISCSLKYKTRGDDYYRMLGIFAFLGILGLAFIILMVGDMRKDIAEEACEAKYVDVVRAATHLHWVVLAYTLLLALFLLSVACKCVCAIVVGCCESIGQRQ